MAALSTRCDHRRFCIVEVFSRDKSSSSSNASIRIMGASSHINSPTQVNISGSTAPNIHPAASHQTQHQQVPPPHPCRRSRAHVQVQSPPFPHVTHHVQSVSSVPTQHHQPSTVNRITTLAALDPTTVITTTALASTTTTPASTTTNVNNRALHTRRRIGPRHTVRIH
jgi:hypothetical protein